MNEQMFKTAMFSYIRNDKGNYDVIKHHYGLGFNQSWRKDVPIPRKLVLGLLRKPHSGYYNQEIEKLVK